MSATAVGLILSQCPPALSAESSGPKRRVLFFTKSSGYQHSVVKRTGDELSFAEKIMMDIGPKHGFDVTCTKDGSVFTPEGLAKYDVFFFYTSGVLTESGTDKTPPMPKEGKAALLDAIKSGKGFVASHCSSDSFHSPGDRYQANVNDVDPYLTMLGGEFIVHGAQQKAKMIACDPKFPGCGDVAGGFELLEEWYSLKNFANDLHVLLVQETAGMTGEPYQRGPYPSTWARRHGKGRVFYTAMGHREDVWTNPLFQNILLGGLSWAAGNVNADVTPNIEKVAPRCGELPPPKKPQPKK